MISIIQNIVKAKYKASHKLFSRVVRIEDKNGAKIKDITGHREKISNITCLKGYRHIDVKAKLEVYVVYYIEEDGEKNPYSLIFEEDIFVRVYRDSFSPLPYWEDFREGEAAAKILNIDGEYDIDNTLSSMSIDISAYLIVYLLRERCIFLDEDNSRQNESYLRQVAISSEYTTRDIKEYLNQLDEAAKKLAKRLEDVEADNLNLKKDMEIKKNEIDQLNCDLVEEKREKEVLSQECTRLLDSLKDMEEKYEKERKRAKLLEVENDRNLEEIKNLKREKNEIMSRGEKDKTTWRQKLKGFIGKE